MYRKERKPVSTERVTVHEIVLPSELANVVFAVLVLFHRPNPFDSLEIRWNVVDKDSIALLTTEYTSVIALGEPSYEPRSHGLFHISDLLLACERGHVLGKQ